MKLYLDSPGIVSGAGNNLTGIQNKEQLVNNALVAQEPNYKIPPMQLRRMSKAVRMSMGATTFSLKEANINHVDAIIVGTAMGCLQDTEAFLNKMLEQNEQMLTPTSFIQSTHNTVAGQIALVTNCNGHNFTYVQRGHSFEHAILDTYLHLTEHPSQNILVGGIDELTTNSLAVMTQAGIYNTDVHAGEGAVFFLAHSNAQSSNSLCIKDVQTFTTTNTEEALARLASFITSNNIQYPDLVLSGHYRDKRTDAFYEFMANQFSSVPVIKFKKLCGEYSTSSSFALGLLSLIKKKRYIIQNSTFDFSNPIKVLLINNYLHYVSYWYIEA